ncbi:MAG TPA: twin-arginine translocase subunit TatC [Anaerolineales bacterium]|nr:twin-arginine translocase subunit TatC [Anaerolineales bacterium]
MRNFLRKLANILTFPFRLIFNLLRGIYRFFANAGRRISTFFAEEPEDSPLPDAFAKTVQNPMGILYHLNALRIHLFRALGALVITVALSLTFVEPIMALLAGPLPGGMETLTAIDVTEPLGTVMKVGLLSGFTLAFPYIAFELYLFIAPGISRHSRIMGLLGIPIATLFFLAGMLFAYYVMIPAALPFLLNFMGINTIPRPSSYFSFITNLMFWIGIAFEFPLVIYLLASLGILKPQALQSQWRLAIVVIAVVAAMITPTIDPVSMSLVMGPLILLYFLSIGLAYLAEGGRRRRAAEQEASA